MDSCSRASILSFYRIDSQIQVSSLAKEILTIQWTIRMMQPSVSLSLIQYMLRKTIKAKKRMLSIKYWDLEILSPVRAAATLLKRRSYILRY